MFRHDATDARQGAAFDDARDSARQTTIHPMAYPLAKTPGRTANTLPVEPNEVDSSITLACANEGSLETISDAK